MEDKATPKLRTDVHPELAFLVAESVKSMTNGQGFRSGMYIVAADDWINGKDSSTVQTCLTTFEPPAEGWKDPRTEYATTQEQEDAEKRERLRMARRLPKRGRWKLHRR